MRIFLIRHGESIQNIGQADNVPDPDIPLTVKGEDQVKDTAKKLRLYLENNNIELNNARMWVSPYLRTEQTADILLQYIDIKSVFRDPRIVEKDFGNFDGVDEDKWEELEPVAINTVRKRYESERSRFFSRLPNGESPFDVYNRISTFIETIYRDEKDPLFIVSHGATIKCFIMRYLHKDIKWYYDYPRLNNAEVILIEKNGKDHRCELIIKQDNLKG